MKKLMIFCCLLYSCSMFAKQITVDNALKVVKTQHGQNPQTRGTAGIRLVQTTKKQSLQRTNQEAPNLYYVFNIGNNKGFTIVSADDVSTPVIAYSMSGNYDPNNLPPNFVEWMTMVEKGIASAIDKDATPTTQVQQAWDMYLSGNISKTRSATSVAPLIATKWGQSSPFWNSIPIIKQKAFVGCVATAMAQIMKYHSYPAKASKATEAYTTKTLGTTIPSLPPIQFDWANMTNTYSIWINNVTKNKAVADLMYHCGAAAKMDYSSTGSGAQSRDAALALVETFGYDNSAEYIFRRGYDNSTWTSLIKKNLDNRLPIYYSGQSATVAHAFICDGYDSQGLFHFNWGWEGYQDGYFSLDAPLEYSQYQEAIINIKAGNGKIQTFNSPLTHTQLAINVAANSIKVGDDIRVTGFAWNFSVKRPFSGEYMIALTDLSGNIKYTIERAKSLSLEIDKYQYFNKTFTVPQIPAGQYKIVVFYRNNGLTEWRKSVGADRNNINDITITIGTATRAAFASDNNMTTELNPFIANEQLIITGLLSSAEVAIYNLSGSLVLKSNIQAGENIPLSNLPLGVYIINVKTVEKAIQNFKVVKN